MNTIYCPNNIEVLIHCHCAIGAHPRDDAPAVREVLEKFVEMGAIEPDPQDGERAFKTTAMGRAWMQALCNVPPPKAAWVDDQGRVLHMTFTEFLTTLRQADVTATKGPWPTIDDLAQFGKDRLILKRAEDIDAIALLRNTLAQTIAIMEVARKALEQISTDHYSSGELTLLGSEAKHALAEMDALAAKTP